MTNILYIHRGEITTDVNISFQVQHDNLIRITPSSIEFIANSDVRNATIAIFGISPGHVDITVNGTINTKDAFIRVLVAVSYVLITVSQIIGWVYFLAWSISFYPQIITNFQRKSVTGLNFDFLALNFLGFILYGIFNVGMYYVPEIQVWNYINLQNENHQPFEFDNILIKKKYEIGWVFKTISTWFESSAVERRIFRLACSCCNIVHNNSMFYLWCLYTPFRKQL